MNWKWKILELYNYKEIEFISFDIDGPNYIRYHWFIENINGFIFVFDSNDSERFEECHYLFEKIINNNKLKECPILFIANKQDLKNVLNPKEIKEKININFRDKKWFTQGYTEKNKIEKGFENGIN